MGFSGWLTNPVGDAGLVLTGFSWALAEAGLAKAEAGFDRLELNFGVRGTSRALAGGSIGAANGSSGFNAFLKQSHVPSSWSHDGSVPFGAWEASDMEGAGADVSACVKPSVISRESAISPESVIACFESVCSCSGSSTISRSLSIVEGFSGSGNRLRSTRDRPSFEQPVCDETTNSTNVRKTTWVVGRMSETRFRSGIL